MAYSRPDSEKMEELVNVLRSLVVDAGGNPSRYIDPESDVNSALMLARKLAYGKNWTD